MGLRKIKIKSCKKWRGGKKRRQKFVLAIKKHCVLDNLYCVVYCVVWCVGQLVLSSIVCRIVLCCIVLCVGQLVLCGIVLDN